MATTNPVKQVLVTTGNAAPIAKDNPISALAVGQVGVFNVHSGLSVDATSPVGNLKEVFLAVGVDPDGTGSLADIVTSAGQVIQSRFAKSYTVKGYVDSLAKIVDIYGFVAKCQTEYGFKIELRNAEIYSLHGYNQFVKTFMYKTGCCAEPCIECGDGDVIELVKGLAEQVSADPDGLVTVTYISNKIEATVTAGASADGSLVVTIGTTAYTVPVLNADTAAVVAGKIVAVVNAQAGSPYVGVATGADMDFFLKAEGLSTDTFALTSAGGTSVTVGTIVAQTKAVVADPDAFALANPGAPLGIRLTSVPAKVKAWCTININYNKMRDTDIIVSLIEGFACNGSATIVQELQYSEGKGYDVQQEEYVAGGHNGRPGPYRVSELTNMPRQGFQYYADKAVNYNLLDLTYDQMSVGGWLEYLNNLQTTVAIPCADTTTLTGLVAILDAVFPQFAPMANDAALLDCTNVATTELDEDTDGIESLS
jgi:hypothetical protein